MYKPNYEKDNIVNLMSSIKKAYGENHLYNHLDLLKPEIFKKYTNVILLVIDGLGYNYLSSYKDSFLYKHLKTRLTGAFPLTTATSNSVFNYGYPAQQHGLTGWFVFLKEIGAVTTILPFTERYFGTKLEEKGFKVEDIVLTESFTKDLDVESYVILNKTFSHSAFSKNACEGSNIISSTPMVDTFDKIKEVISKNNNKKFVHAYIEDFDSTGHHYGVESDNTYDIFKRIDNDIKNVVDDLKGTNSIILVTADHGMKDARIDQIINLRDYPDIMDCLVMPLSGDSRTRYLYVKPRMVAKFEKLILDNFGDISTLYSSEELLDNNWFGLYNEHRNLKHRIGDYVIIMKDGYVLTDDLLNEKNGFVKGHHGGISSDEIYVPLVVINP